MENVIGKMIRLAETLERGDTNLNNAGNRAKAAEIVRAAVEELRKSKEREAA